MTLSIVVGTLAVVAWSAVKVWQAHKRIVAARRGWCDCQVCAPARAQLAARLTDLFTDTPTEEQ